MKARQEDVVWREVEGQTVILDLKTSSYLTTNVSGTRMWQLLQDGRQQLELEEELISAYGISEEDAKRDVISFLDMLRENNFLVE